MKKIVLVFVALIFFGSMMDLAYAVENSPVAKKVAAKKSVKPNSKKPVKANKKNKGKKSPRQVEAIADDANASSMFATEQIQKQDECPNCKFISAKDACDAEKNGGLLIDVRSAEEFYYHGHAEGAINIPLVYPIIKEGDLKKRVEHAKMEIEKNKVFPVGFFLSGEQVNINFINEINEVAGNDKARKIVILDKYGRRAAKAFASLQAEGFTNLYVLKDGFEGWKRAYDNSCKWLIVK